MSSYFHILVNSLIIWSVLKLPKIAWPSPFNIWNLQLEGLLLFKSKGICRSMMLFFFSNLWFGDLFEVRVNLCIWRRYMLSDCGRHKDHSLTGWTYWTCTITSGTIGRLWSSLCPKGYFNSFSYCVIKTTSFCNGNQEISLSWTGVKGARFWK